MFNLKHFFIGILFCLSGYCQASQGDQANTQAREQITFSCGLSGSQWEYRFKPIFTEAFASIGYDFDIVNINIARALTEVNNGRFDGLCARIEEVENTFNKRNNFIKIDVPIRTTTLTAWSHDPEIAKIPPEKFNEKKLITAIVRGALISEKFIKSNNLQRVIKTATMKDALKLLAAKRVNVAIGGFDMIKAHVKNHPDWKIVKVSAFHQYKTFPYIHRNKAHLLNKIEKALKEQLEIESIIEASENFCSDTPPLVIVRETPTPYNT